MSEHKKPKADDGITRKVFFQPWCRRCGWKGEETDFKTAAAFALAAHRTDRHPLSRPGSE